MIARLKQNKTARQTLYLFMAQIFGLVIGFISNILLAKEMGVDTFGIYAFSLAIISFLAVFFEFGYFSSISRLLAKAENKEVEKELIGVSLVIVFIISTLFFATIFIVSLFIDNIFEDKVGDVVRVASIVSWSFIIPFYMELILRGCNHIEVLSAYQLMWKIIFIIFLFILFYQNNLTPLYVLYALSISCITSFAYFIFKLNPNISNIKSNLLYIQKENNAYGKHIYFGRAIDTSTYNVDKLMIGYFVGVKDVGLYTLASSMANPINIFSTSLSSSKFKSFSNGDPIAKNIIKINFTWIVLAIIGANGLGYIIINVYLGEAYKDVLLLLFLMSMAAAFQASYRPYNAWLNSNGYGGFLKKKAYYTASINVLLNILLIPLYGVVGAVSASILSMATSYVLYIYYYRKGLRSK